MENGPPCKKRMAMPSEELLQGTSLALNFVTYQEFNTLRVEHEQMKAELQTMRGSIISDIHKSLFDELDAVKRENHSLKKEITSLKRAITNKDRTANDDDVHNDIDTCITEGIRFIDNGSTKSSHFNPPVPGKEALSFMKNVVSYYDGSNDTSKDCAVVNTHKPDMPPTAAPLLSHTIEDVNWEHAVLTPNKPTPDDSVYSQRAQLLPEYNIWVNRSKLHALLQEAESDSKQGAIIILRRIMMLVFSLEEMAHSRGQGIMHKSTDNVQLMNREPLDPVKVQACKDYMRKWCYEHGQVEPTDKTINSVITHQITYARTKLKRMASKGKNNSSGASMEGGDYYRDDYSSCQADEEDSQGAVKEEYR